MGEKTVYLVTKQLGSSSPHARDVFGSIEDAVARADSYTDRSVPDDLSKWERRNGNQHAPTRWRYWYLRDDGCAVNIYVRKFTVQ